MKTQIDSRAHVYLIIAYLINNLIQTGHIKTIKLATKLVILPYSYRQSYRIEFHMKLLIFRNSFNYNAIMHSLVQ